MLTETFRKSRPILGKVQVLPLPGAQDWSGQWEPLIARAEQEATALASGGVDGLIIENAHDAPYAPARLDAAGAIAMAMLARRVGQLTQLPVGVSVLRNDPETALAIVANGCASFIRVPLLSGALITGAGIINSRLNELLRYKSMLKTELPPLLIDLSGNHVGPAPLLRAPVAETGDGRLAHLIHLAKALPKNIGPYAVVLSNRDIDAGEIAAFKETTGELALIELQRDSQAAEACFEEADGLILDAGIRRNAPLSPQASGERQSGVRGGQSGVFGEGQAGDPVIPPAIDMIRVEELVNRLRHVVPVSELDPDIFLRR